MFGYAILVGKGTPKNAEKMREAIQKTYGEEKAKKFFSLADYFRKEAEEKAIEQGIKKGIEKGIKALCKEGLITKEQAERKIQEMKKK